MAAIMYLKCFLIALIGAALQAAMYLRSTQKKSQLANVEFSPSPIQYLKEDWLSVCISGLTIILCLLLVGEALNLKPEILDYIQFAFAFIGYFSNDIASRIFGAMNKRVNAAIDYKTTIADQVTGTTGAPTPATPPQKPQQ